MKKKTISLKNSRSIFRNEYTKVRPEDLLRISQEKAKFMSIEELNQFKKFSDKVFAGESENFEFIARRKKGKVEFIPFDE